MMGDSMKDLTKAMNEQHERVSHIMNVMMGKFGELSTQVAQHQTQTSNDVSMLSVSVKSLVAKFEANEKRVERVESELASFKRVAKGGSEVPSGSGASEGANKRQNTSKGPQGRGRWGSNNDMEVDDKAIPAREGGGDV